MEGLSTNTQLLFFFSFLGTLGGFWALPQPCPLLLIHLALTLYASCLGLGEQQQHSHHPSKMTGTRDLK